MAGAPGDRDGIVLRNNVAGADQDATARTRRFSPPPSPGLVARELWPVVASATLVYLASTAFTTAVPLWLTAEGNGQRIGRTLAAYSLAAAGRGLFAAALASRIAPSRLLPLTTAAVIAPLIGVVTWAPGTPHWFPAVTPAGALAHAGTPVLWRWHRTAFPVRLAQRPASDGPRIGLAAVLFIPLTAAVAPWGQLVPVTVAGLGLLPAALISRRTLQRSVVPSSVTILAAASCTCGGIPRAPMPP
ncbi:MAG TPA: hypothetical protein VGR26_15465 [Acidimicrobiales bacterium]|nr:hypothetical protein [Acidimicrobiales bacterium]